MKQSVVSELVFSPVIFQVTHLGMNYRSEQSLQTVCSVTFVPSKGFWCAHKIQNIYEGFIQFSFWYNHMVPSINEKFLLAACHPRKVGDPWVIGCNLNTNYKSEDDFQNCTIKFYASF